MFFFIGSSKNAAVHGLIGELKNIRGLIGDLKNITDSVMSPAASRLRNAASGDIVYQHSQRFIQVVRKARVCWNALQCAGFLQA